MATYRHKCNNEECETIEFEDRRPMDEHDKPTPCPQCGEISQKLISQTSFALKGAGWFNTGGYGASYKPVGDIMKRSDSAK